MDDVTDLTPDQINAIQALTTQFMDRIGDLLTGRNAESDDTSETGATAMLGLMATMFATLCRDGYFQSTEDVDFLMRLAETLPHPPEPPGVFPRKLRSRVPLLMRLETPSEASAEPDPERSL